MSPKPVFSHSTRVRGHYEDDNNHTFITDDVQEPSGEHSGVPIVYLDPAPLSEVPGFCQRSVVCTISTINECQTDPNFLFQ